MVGASIGTFEDVETYFFSLIFGVSGCIFSGVFLICSLYITAFIGALDLSIFPE